MMIPTGKNYFGIVKIQLNLKSIPSDDKPLFLDYYGNYIALIAILYADNRKISFLSLLSSLIAFSPIPFIITFYIAFYKHL